MEIPEQCVKSGNNMILESLLLNLNIIHTLFLGVSIVDFEQTNAGWVGTITSFALNLFKFI